MCQTIIMCENKNTVISQCNDCQGLFIWHNNLMLSFSQEDFRQFNQTIHSLPFDGHSYSFPDGENRMILRTPNIDISFCFRRKEFEDFCTLIGESVYLMDLYAMIRHN